MQIFAVQVYRKMVDFNISKKIPKKSTFPKKFHFILAHHNKFLWGEIVKK